jgi:hypothetical protein
MIGSYTIFHSATPIGKQLKLVDGEVKKFPLGELYAGTYERKNFSSPEEFIEQLCLITNKQVITGSVPLDGTLTGGITTKRRPEAGALPRDIEHYGFPDGAGVMTMDYDPRGTVFRKDELINLLRSIADIPDEAALIWWCSASSHIYNGDVELKGLSGQRIYLLVEDARDIKRAGEVLNDRCWLLGYGRIDFSEAGHRLLRTIFDEAMYENARLDFAGGAVCEEPLTQNRGAPLNVGGSEFLNTSLAFKDLSADEAAIVDRLKKDAKDKALPESVRLKALWIENRKDILRDRLLVEDKTLSPLDAEDRARHILRAAVEGNSLAGDFELELEFLDGTTEVATVAKVLDNKVKYHKVRTRDPLVRNHRGGEYCGMLYLDQSAPRLFSFAHGGVSYKLIRQSISVEVKEGDQSITAKIIAKALLAYEDLFLSGGVLVYASGGVFIPLNANDISQLVGERISLHSKAKDGARRQRDCKPQLVGAIQSALRLNDDLKPPTILGVTNSAYATPQKRLVLDPGYDPETGVYNRMLERVKIPKEVEHIDVLRALKTIWAPFVEYKWASDEARSAALAAVFTAVLRPAMETAPGFFLDAAQQGSGKSKAMDAICAISQGRRTARYPYVKGNHNDEYSKYITSMMQCGLTAWPIDNVINRFESTVIASLIFSTDTAGRVLGANTVSSGSARILVVATGNNAELGEDLNRRFLCARIDTRSERPDKDKHTFDPQTKALATRGEIIRAVLTILQAYWNDSPVQVDNSACPDFGSLVQEPMVWLSLKGFCTQAGVGNIVDPILALGSNLLGETEEQFGLRQLLLGIEGVFGLHHGFTSAELLRVYDGIGAKPKSEAYELLKLGLDELTKDMAAMDGAAGRKESTRAAAIGLVLKRSKGKTKDNVRLELQRTDAKGKSWCLEMANPEGGARRQVGGALKVVL